MKVKPFKPLNRPVGALLSSLIALQLLRSSMSESLVWFVWRPVLGPMATYSVLPQVNMLATAVQVLVFAAFVVVFLLWVYRLSAQLHAQSEMRPAYSPGWAVGWFLIPVANLVMPYLVLRDLWAVVRKDEKRRGSFLLLWWWLWLPGTALSYATWFLIVYPMFSGRATLRVIDMVAQALVVAAPMLAMAMVLEMARAYARGFRDVEETAASTPAVAEAHENGTPPGWYPDPAGRHDARYWNGIEWTENVTSRGLTGSDPL